MAELWPGVAGTGLPELNSAHRGHFRLVSTVDGTRQLEEEAGLDSTDTYSYDPFGRNVHNAAKLTNVSKNFTQRSEL